MWSALFFADCQSLRSWKRPLALKKQRMDYDTEHRTLSFHFFRIPWRSPWGAEGGLGDCRHRREAGEASLRAQRLDQRLN